jgi:hypothetical protein
MQPGVILPVTDMPGRVQQRARLGQQQRQSQGKAGQQSSCASHPVARRWNRAQLSAEPGGPSKVPGQVALPAVGGAAGSWRSPLDSKRTEPKPVPFSLPVSA